MELEKAKVVNLILDRQITKYPALIVLEYEEEILDQSSFQWIPDEWGNYDTIDIYNLERATKVFCKSDGNETENEPSLVRYLKFRHKDINIIKKWLNAPKIRYVALVDKNSSLNYKEFDTLLDWRDSIDNELDLASFGKLIYLNLESTIHHVNFNVGDVSEQTLKNHQEYHSWSCILPSYLSQV
jgi:hypothetical protein